MQRPRERSDGRRERSSDISPAHVDCTVALNVTTDGPLQVDLAGCGVGKQFGV
jgi:hypothetical protein